MAAMHPDMTPSPLFLLAIRGTLASPVLETSRRTHNTTAGVPASVAAAQSLGDLSHMVHIPVEDAVSGGNEFLILDIWNSLEGLNKFFANPQVQEEAGRIFSARDPTVWTSAQGFTSYHIPAPHGKNDRIVAVARGTLRGDEAKALHNKTVADQINKARRSGSMAHEAYARLAQPGTPGASEFLFLDFWMSVKGMSEHYQDPEFMRSFGGLFASPPATSTWVHPPGDWVEW